jgi:uncharacterized protein
MPHATFRFYAELNDFLPPERRHRQFKRAFQGRVAVKDMIEALGVPHTEVDLIVVNGESMDFGWHVQDGDFISVYPMFESLDIGPAVRVRAQPLRVTRFLLDTHLGRLAAYLRMLGFDSSYRNDSSDDQLAWCSRGEQRILLTRDRGLLKRRLVTHGYCVREIHPRQQLVEVVLRFDLAASIRPFSRCLRCNACLEAVDKAGIWDQLPQGTREVQIEFRRCPQCKRVYWKGSHYLRMHQLIQEACMEAGRL